VYAGYSHETVLPEIRDTSFEEQAEIEILNRIKD
jgi:hypothetical protein